MKTLVLGLGNPLVSDDSIGLRVAREVKSRLGGRADVEVEEDHWGGLRLMERMIGYDRAIVIDAVCTGTASGTIHFFRPDDVPVRKSVSSHDIGLPAGLQLGRQAGMQLPDDQQIVFVGIEAEDVETLAEQCTPAVARAIPRAAEEVLRTLDEDFAIR
jgi:hydrogenase maturation protease